MINFKNQNKLKAITFSFDDGVTQDIRMIELLNKYNLKATFNINSELLGRNGSLTRNNGMRIAHYKVWADDVKKIYEGHEVAVHTLTHPNLTKLDEAEIIRQVEQDRKNLEDLVEYDIVGMAYPCGGTNNDDRVAEILKTKTKILYSRTITCTGNFDLQDNLYRFNPSVYFLDWDLMMDMGKRFVDLKPDKPQIFYIWGHSYEMDYDSRNWKRLEDFFELISNREDIYYGTNREVLL